MTDVAELRRLVDQNPWTTLVSNTPDGLIASHYAVLLDDDRDDLTIVGHVGKPDDMIHGLGERELLVVVQGPHGYISPGWYGDVQSVPTWNFVSAHLSGIPEILAPEENLRVLDRLVARFERRMPRPRLMWERPNDPAFVERLERGTVGFRLTPTRVVAKRKLSQNKSAEVVETVIAELERRRPLREPRPRRRDAPRPRCDGAPVTRHRVDRRHDRRERAWPAPDAELLPTDDAVDVFLERRSHRRHRARRRAAPPGRGARRRRRAGSSPDSGTTTCTSVQWALVAQRQALGHARVGRARRADHGGRRRSTPTAAGSAPASATRCGRTDRGWRCSTRRPATCPRTSSTPTCTACGSTPPRCVARAIEPDGVGDPARSARVRDLPATERRRSGAWPTRWSRRWHEDAASRGVVGIVDLDMAWNDERLGAPSRRRLRQPPRGVRHLPRPARAGDRRGTAHRRRRAGSAPTSSASGSLKVITDGSLGTRTAACSHAYPGDPAQSRHADGRARDARSSS